MASVNYNWLILFPNCLPVKGATRGIIFDSQRRKYFIVPLGMFEILEKLRTSTKDNLLDTLIGEDRLIVEEYISFLLKNELAFFVEDIQKCKRFPELSMQWTFPSIITNAIIWIDSRQRAIDFNIFKDNFYIPYIQFFIKSDISSLIELRDYLDIFCVGNTKGIQVIFDNRISLGREELVGLANSYPIESLIAHNSHNEETIRSIICNIVFTREAITDFQVCGRVSVPYFNLQLTHFTESQHHNTCLNRKISIDVDGNIKNCPSMAKSYGNIRDTKLIDVVNNPEFQKVWHIKKDEITKCKDCEFRHVCTDCRAYLDNPDDLYSAPLKCGYNPYTCEWEEWSTNPLKQQAIEFYGMQDLVKRP